MKFTRIIILLFPLILAPLRLSAQEPDFDNMPVVDYSNDREYEIAGITVSGVQFLQKEVLISISGLKVGEKIRVPSDRLTKIIKKFWDQGLFADVKLTATKIENGKIWLDIYLKEQPRLSKLIVKGLKKAETDDLKEKLNLRPGSQVTDDVLNNTERIIKEHFIEKGFYNAAVKMTQVPDTTRGNAVDLYVTVQKNDRVKVEDIIFRGNQVFSDKRLRRVMKNTKKVNLNFFKPSKMIKADYKEDKEKLYDFYNKNGYRDFKLIEDSIGFVEKSRIMLYITVEEGDKYYFRNIKWVGNTKFPSEDLSAVLGIEKGEVFDQSLLNKRLLEDEDAVSNYFYLDHGYLFSSIEPVEVRVDHDSIDFEMRVYEGKQATVNNVIIKGNTKTKEHVIRREIRTKPGDLFSRQDLVRTVRELAQLGHFDPEQINPVPIPNPQDGTVDLEYNLVERANDQLEISGGWGANMLVGTIGLRFSNFATSDMLNPKAWRPIPMGDGQTLSVRAQSNGSYYKAYNMSFVEPWFGGKKPNSLVVSLYHTVTTNASYFVETSDKSFKISGASVGLGRRLKWPDDFFTLYNEASFQQYKLKDWSGFLFTNGTSNNFSFTSTFSRNSIDQPIYPRRGSKFSLSLQVTPPYSLFSGKDYANLDDGDKYNLIEYHKWKFSSEWYTSLAGNLVLSTRAQFGYLGYYNPDIGPSPFEGFDVGGDGMTGYNIYGYETIALRGYSNSSLTPRVNGYKAGNVYTKLTMELRYPITLNPSATVFALAFLEGGDAWYSIDQFNPFIIKRSAGIGLRAFLPMFGLLGIDWGYGFDDVPGMPDANKGNFHFTIGQQF